MRELIFRIYICIPYAKLSQILHGRNCFFYVFLHALGHFFDRRGKIALSALQLDIPQNLIKEK